jgi:hypothetical protein
MANTVTSVCLACRMIWPYLRTRLRTVLSESTSSWVCQPRRRATEAKGSSCDSKHAHSWRPQVMIMPLCGGKGSVAGHHVGLRPRMSTDLAGKGARAETASDGDHLVVVGVDGLRGKNAGGGAPSARHR